MLCDRFAPRLGECYRNLRARLEKLNFAPSLCDPNAELVIFSFCKICLTMHIAIDVHSLGANAGGNETYFQQLLRGLVQDTSDHRYSLFYTHTAAPVAN